MATTHSKKAATNFRTLGFSSPIALDFEKKQVFTNGTSAYLDVLRFLAAFSVYIYHAGHFSGFQIPVIGNLGSQGVIVFFVLSGLVISFSADTKHTDIWDFMIARVARLWSVVIPALFLTFVLDKVGQAISIESYNPMQPYSAFKWVASIATNSLFLNQVWSLSVWPGTNGPFWSLSYEFWYYVIFASAIFLRGKTRVITTLAAMLIAGPGIITGFPVWILGVYVYARIKKSQLPRQAYGWTLWCISLVTAAMYISSGGKSFLAHFFLPTFSFSNKEWDVNFWPESYLIGTLVAMNIYGAATILKYPTRKIERFSRPIRHIADTSFGLYLLHYPLMYFTKACLSGFGLSNGWTFILLMYILPFLASILIALKCEDFKYDFLRLSKRAAEKLGYKGPARVEFGRQVSMTTHSGEAAAVEERSA